MWDTEVGVCFPNVPFPPHEHLVPSEDEHATRQLELSTSENVTENRKRDSKGMKSQFLPPRCQQQEQKTLVEEGPGHLAGLEKGTGDCVGR